MCFCVILVAFFRYNCSQLLPHGSCHHHSKCEPEEKCCKGKCSRNCSFVCSSHEDCTLDETCCSFDENFTRTCAESCIGKSCESYHDCGSDEICCSQNSGTGQCARSCTIGKWCASDVSCGSGEFCCLNETGGRQCSESCTVEKSCITDEDCLSRKNGECCDNGRCKPECKTKGKSQHIWYTASGALICILFFVIVFQIGRRTRCHKASEAEAPRHAGEAICSVTRGTIDLENQLQHCAEQEPPDTRNSNSYPNHPPPPYTNQHLHANQSIAPIPNLPPPPYPDQLPPPYQD